jgi:XTP/dITP diphosphohydrolase
VKRPDSVEIVLATSNAGKVREIVQIVAGLDVRVRPLGDFPGMAPVDEDGDTFRANAEKKARAVHAHTGRVAVADDSGICVDALGGAPGVRSARYAGEGAGDAENNRALLAALAGFPPERRGATFVCAVCVYPVAGEAVFLEGTCRGVVLGAPRGNGGFGYDPLFLVPDEGMTFAELPPETKNRISHRGRALAGLAGVLRRIRG